MKTRHQFNAGDLIRHGELTGVVIHRGLANNCDTVLVAWDDGTTQFGQHSRLWMCERADNYPTEAAK